MDNMLCKKCGMTFDSRAVYGYACPHGSNCGPIELRTELWLDPMPRFDVSLPPPVGYVTREEYDRLRDELAEARRERDGYIELAAHFETGQTAFLSWLRGAGEHMRDEGVTVCDDGVDSGAVLAAKVPECAALLKARAEAAEAAARTARETAIREAAEVVPNGWTGKPHMSNMDYGPNTAAAARTAILALLDSPPAGSKTVEG